MCMEMLSGPIHKCVLRVKEELYCTLPRLRGMTALLQNAVSARR